MKLERLHEYVTGTVVILAGLGFAVLAGRWSGTGQTRTMWFIFAAIICITLTLQLRGRIWVLMPLFWPLSGSITALQIPFSVRDLAILLVVGSFLVLRAVKVIRTKPRYGWIEFLILINLLYLATVFIRNPVGIQAFGAELVGGRPYFNVFLATLAVWVLVSAVPSVTAVRSIPWLMLTGTGMGGVVGFIADYFPRLAAPLAPIYSGFAVNQVAEIQNMDGVVRKTGLTEVGIKTFQALCAYVRPVTIFLPYYPLRFVLGCFGVYALLMGGFRTAILMVMVFFFLSSYFRKRLREMLPLAVIGVVLMAFLALAQGRILNLPLPAQRALSFLPGEWDYRAVESARGSSEWRFEMWRIVLREGKWIKNKWLGDGFGFTRTELAIANSALEGGPGFIGGGGSEAQLITGAYHSGPLSAIRYAGVVGLILFLTLLISLAIRAAQLIRRTYGSNLFPVALFVGMPLIYEPFLYTFIFGGYDSGLPNVIFAAGLFRLLENTVDTLPGAPEPPPVSSRSRTVEMRPTIERPRYAPTLGPRVHRTR